MLIDLDAEILAVPCGVPGDLDALSGRAHICPDRMRLAVTECMIQPCNLVGTLHEAFCKRCGFPYDQPLDFATYCHDVWQPYTGRVYHFAVEGLLGRGPFELRGKVYAKMLSEDEAESEFLCDVLEGQDVGESSCESDPYSFRSDLTIKPWWHHVLLYVEGGCVLEATGGHTTMLVTRSEMG